MYTYAFLPTPPHPLALPLGIAQPVEILSQGHLAALVEPNVDVAALEMAEDRLMQAVLSHDRVLREIFAQTVVLPLRFGTAFRSSEALLNHLTEQASHYETQLQRLANKAEFTLKCLPLELIPPAIALPTTGQGRDYFLAKKRQYQTQLAQQQQQQTELEHLTIAIAETFPESLADTANPNKRFYLLLDSEQTQILTAQLPQWQTQSPTWDLQLSEPLPPYHFVT